MKQMFKTIEEELDYKYYESFKEFWIPIYKRQVFKAKYYEDVNTLLAIKENIYKNIHLEDYRYLILKELGIYYLYK